MQPWYRTIDDYAIALWDANTKGSTIAIRQWLVRAGLSNPYSGAVLVGANALALAALVAFDPADLRSKSPSGRSAMQVLGNDPVLRGELEQGLTNLKEAYVTAMTTQQGLVKDDEGQIEIM